MAGIAVAGIVRPIQKHSSPRLDPSVQYTGQPWARASGHNTGSSNGQLADVQLSPPQPGFPPISSSSSSSKTGSGRGSGRALSSPNRRYPASLNFYRPRCIHGGTGAGTAPRRDSLQHMIYINAHMETGLQPKHGFYTYGGISNTPHFPGVSSVGCRKWYVGSGSIRASVHTGGSWYPWLRWWCMGMAPKLYDKHGSGD